MASIQEKGLQINNLLETVGYRQFESTVEDGSSQNNFFGKVYRVHVKGTKNRKTVSDHLLVKTHDDNFERNNRLKITEKFEREAFLYNEVIREYERLQIGMKDDGKLHFPTCLYADREWLILEDLSVKSYRDVDEKSTLDIEHMKVTMKSLGKFHALSFALKTRKPEQYERFREALKHPNIPDQQRRIFIVEKVWQWTIDAIEDNEVKKRLVSRKQELTDESMIDSESTVICHGDFNLRNILFHYNDQNLPDNLMMIDFQLSYVSSPVADILFAVFSSTSSQLRRSEYENLKNIYYESFRQHLLSLNCDPDSIYSRSTFESDFFKYFPREFATIIVVLRLMCIAFKKPKKNLDKNAPAPSTILDYNCEEAERIFKYRINCVIDDFAQLGYI